MKIKIMFNLEVGYRVQLLNENSFVKSSEDISSEELPEVMRELAGMTGEDVDDMLVQLRRYYELFNLKSMTFDVKENK